MPKSVIPAKPEFIGWKYFEDFGDGSHVFCLLCASVDEGRLYKVNISILIMPVQYLHISLAVFKWCNRGFEEASEGGTCFYCKGG